MSKPLRSLAKVSYLNICLFIVFFLLKKNILEVMIVWGILQQVLNIDPWLVDPPPHTHFRQYPNLLQLLYNYLSCMDNVIRQWCNCLWPEHLKHPPFSMDRSHIPIKWGHQAFLLLQNQGQLQWFPQQISKVIIFKIVIFITYHGYQKNI